MNEPEATAAEVVHLTQQLNVFFAHLDERRYDELAGVFAADGRWLRQGQWLEGREAILAAMRQRPASVRVRHVISNVIVTRRGACEAEVDAYMTAYRRLPNQPPTLFSINTVGNVFRREDGRWLLAEQRLVRDFEFEAP